jgi:hypothetical protein
VVIAINNHRQRVSGHFYKRFCTGFANRFGFTGNVHHVGITGRINVG